MVLFLRQPNMDLESRKMVEEYFEAKYRPLKDEFARKSTLPEEPMSPKFQALLDRMPPEERSQIPSRDRQSRYEQSIAFLDQKIEGEIEMFTPILEELMVASGTSGQATKEMFESAVKRFEQESLIRSQSLVIDTIRRFQAASCHMSREDKPGLRALDKTNEAILRMYEEGSLEPGRIAETLMTNMREQGFETPVPEETP